LLSSPAVADANRNRIRIQRLGLRRVIFGDLYHYCMVAAWWQFFGLIAIVYGSTNAVFALAYFLAPGCIENARPGFLDMFFFSVQTMATIGYGKMVPITTYANTLVTLESLLGIFGVALVTGLTFAKFARPTPRVSFSKVAVVSKRDGQTSLMVRMANERQSYIVDVNLFMVLAMNDVTPEGEKIRRFHTLTLQRDRAATFALSWTAIHPIDERSAMNGIKPEDLAAKKAEVILVITGIDETFAQQVHAVASFSWDKILFGRRFSDIVTQLDDGRRILDHGRLDETLAAE
jgi:inward rectifier potassium channel